MTGRRIAILLVGCASLFLACNKQKAETSAPDDDAAAAPASGDREAEEPATSRDFVAADPEATLAGWEAELAARKAELAARGVTHEGKASSATTRQKQKKGETAKKRKPKTSEPEAGRPATKATTSTANETDACAPICGPAAAICDLADRICALASEHEDEPRFTGSCERAEDDCEAAQAACEECRG